MAKLYFYFSAMNAGKSTTLLQSAHNYRERGMRTLILTPRLDDRAGVGVVSSRIGLRAPALAFAVDDDLERLVADDIAGHGDLHCVLVDESQFLTRDQVLQLTMVCDQLGVPVQDELVTGSFSTDRSPGDLVAGRRLLFVPTFPTNNDFSNGWVVVTN